MEFEMNSFKQLLKMKDDLLEVLEKEERSRFDF